MNDDVWRFSDDLGPQQIAYLYDPSTRLRAIVVVDNVACGPSIGGARMEPDVSVDECFRLARAMTFKNAAAGIPHGGGKSVIFADPKMDIGEKERLMRSFARAIGDIRDYIVGPDMGNRRDLHGMVLRRDRTGRGTATGDRGDPSGRDRRDGLPDSASARRRRRSSARSRWMARGSWSKGSALSDATCRAFSARWVRVWSPSRIPVRATVSDGGLDVADLIEHKATGASVVRVCGR